MAEAELPQYEVLAIRFATRNAKRRDHFIAGDPVDADMPMDYFLFVILGEGRTIVVDTGFTEATAIKRKRDFLCAPAEALRLVGVDPDKVDDVIMTHLHYDHAGNFDTFPNARFHLQAKEMNYVTGPEMRHPFLARAYETEDILNLVKLNFARRVVWYDGDAEFAPGIDLFLAGGHSPGLQFLRVNTMRGPVVLATDVSHFYENMETGRPFMAALDVVDMVNGFGMLYRQAPSPNHIVPGHDPLILKRYPPLSPELNGIAACLHLDPI